MQQLEQGRLTISSMRYDKLEILSGLVADRAFNRERKRRKICIFLGAGADISSGGVTFSQLKKRSIERFSDDRVFDLTTPAEIDQRFDALFSSLDTTDRAALVEAIFAEMNPLGPSDSYKLLVLLAEAGGVDAVVTTNFDIMLECAQDLLGRNLFQVYAPGTARPDVRYYSQYDLPKRPYLKLHGDLASRTVTQLTASELVADTYDAAVVSLLSSILESHDLVIAGYSGFDPALAELIAKAVNAEGARIFWCNPSDVSDESPLRRQIATEIEFIRIDFDALMKAIARPVLERPSLINTKPTYVPCLLDWRIEYCNSEYRRLYGDRLGKSLDSALVKRPEIERRLLDFMKPNRPLAIITGPSGFGKTTIGLRLHQRWAENAFVKVLLLRAKSFPESGDLEQHISEQIGGLGYSAPFSLFYFQKWLKENDIQLIVYVDGVNEFSPDITRCVSFFRDILRVSYFLPEENSSIRIIATVRQETWTAMLPYLDLGQLRKTVWLDQDTEQSFTTISCNEFTDGELREALSKFARSPANQIDLATLSQSTVRLLRDPYFLRMVGDAFEDGAPLAPTPAAYRVALESKLRRAGSTIGSATIEGVLSELALVHVDSGEARFRELDIKSASLRPEILRLAKDLNILVDVGGGQLQFDHDRTFEYFLAQAFASGRGPSLDTLSDLSDFLDRFPPASRAFAAARLYFHLHPDKSFELVTRALRLLDDGGASRPRGAERLFGFARQVLIQMAEWGHPLARKYLADAIEASTQGDVGEQQLRTVVQATANLGAEEAVRLLGRVRGHASQVAQTEAAIYAIDKLVKGFYASERADLDFLSDAPYRTFLSDPTLPKWRLMGRLMAFASQVGPDNSHPDEYEAFRRALTSALSGIGAREAKPAEVENFLRYFVGNIDRLMYAATPQSIQRFFGNPGRSRLLELLDRLAAGKVIAADDLHIFEPYAQSLTFDVEYHISHALLLISSLNDISATLDVMVEKFETFSNNSAPEEVDFFDGALVYLTVIHGLEYDVNRFSKWEAIVLDSWPDILMYRPGLQRGERRGYLDPFDRVFEDGFGVIFPYGILLPSNQRRQLKYADYIESARGYTGSPLPLYTDHLEAFLEEGRIDEALQILQALSAVVVAWPLEGLAALRTVVGNPDSRIRRAVVRILAEALNRHPEETYTFLNSSGLALSEDELIEIKIRQDARIGRRQINEEEWARMVHFLLSLPGGREALIDCVRIALQEKSIEEVAVAVFQRLGLTTAPIH